MLQESTVSEGPRVPWSIQSTPDSIETQTTTLMRTDFYHEIPEFSDLRCRMTSDGPEHARTGGIMPGRVESCQDGSDPCMIHLIKAEPHRSWPQGPCRGPGSGPWPQYCIWYWIWVLDHASLGTPCMTLPVHPCHATPGTPVPPHPALAVADPCIRPCKRVLWAQ